MGRVTIPQRWAESLKKTTRPAVLSVLMLSLLNAACVRRYREPPPIPLELIQAPPTVPPEPCEPSQGPGAPVGHTPPPSAEGELSLSDVRGDDRFAIAGYAAFAWSSDGERVISATKDGLLLWSAAKGELLRHIKLDARIERPDRIVMSPDDQWIAFTADIPPNSQSKAWEAALFLVSLNGEPGVQIFRGVGGPMAFTPDSRSLFTYGHTWDLAAGTHAPRPPLNQEVMILPDGARAVLFIRQGISPKQTYTPELRDLASGRVLHRFPALTASIAAALSGDGRRLALVRERSLTVYSTESFEPLAHIPGIGDAIFVHLSHDGHRAVVEVLRCSVPLSSGPKEAFPCPEPRLTVWDLDKKEPILQRAQGSGKGWIFSGDGEYLTGPDTRLVDHLIRIRDGADLRFGSRIRALSPDGRRVIYDDHLGFGIASLDNQSPVPAFARASRVLSRSPNGRLRAALAQNGRLQLESSTSCIRLGITSGDFLGPKDPYDHLDPERDQVVFSRDGVFLYTVVGATSMHARFRAYNTSDGRETWSIQATGSGGGSAFILPEAEQVVLQAYQHPDVLRFDARTGAPLPKGRMPRIAYKSPTLNGFTWDVRDVDGDRVGYLTAPVSGRDGLQVVSSSFLDNKCFLSFWNLRDPEGVDDRPSGCAPLRKALSPNEQWLAASEEKGHVQIFDWHSHASRPVVEAHAGGVRALVFSPSGDRVASAGEDGTIFWMDPRDGSIRGRARLPLDHAERLWISPDGHELVADTARGLQVRFRVNGGAR